VMRHTHLEPAEQLAYRRRAPYRALLPRLELSYSQLATRGFDLIRNGLYPVLPYWRDEDRAGATRELRVVAVWDLAQLVFHSDAPLLGRTARLAHDLWLTLYREVSHYHSELRRVRALLAAGGLDLRTRVQYRLRVQELQSLLDRMSGGYLRRWHRARRGADRR